MSRASVPPANASPGARYARGPIRRSLFRPRETSAASAPTDSQIAATSLMKATEVARKPLSACLVISADSTRIHSTSAPNGASSSASSLPVLLAAHPGDDPVGRAEGLQGAAQAQVLGHARKAQPAVAAARRRSAPAARRRCRPAAARRRSRAHRSGAARAAPAARCSDPLDVGVVVVVDRRVERHPRARCAAASASGVGREAQARGVAAPAARASPGSDTGGRPRRAPRPRTRRGRRRSPHSRPRPGRRRSRCPDATGRPRRSARRALALRLARRRGILSQRFEGVAAHGGVGTGRVGGLDLLPGVAGVAAGRRSAGRSSPAPIAAGEAAPTRAPRSGPRPGRRAPRRPAARARGPSGRSAAAGARRSGPARRPGAWRVRQ